MKKRLDEILQRIEEVARRHSREPESVRLVAVSKTVTAERVRQAIEAGVTTLGENYVQEAREKYDVLGACPVSWHFIGRLQSNKAKYVVRMFDLIHSVDSLKLAQAIDKSAAKIAKRQPILIQVNLSGEATKAGISEADTLALIEAVSRLEHVEIRGLMTMPPFFDDPERARPYFRSLRLLRDRVQASIAPDVAMTELSMGMTGDFVAAIAEGATLVRIGTAIFGAR